MNELANSQRDGVNPITSKGSILKRRYRGVRTFLLRFAVLTFFVWFCTSLLSPFDDREFDSASWRQHAGSSDWQSPRGPMYEDLRRTLLRDRATREGVVLMMGEPDESGRDGVLRYRLGAWSGLRIDLDTMSIAFDESGRVSSVYRVQG
jgi:hypothetical protein